MGPPRLLLCAGFALATAGAFGACHTGSSSAPPAPYVPSFHPVDSDGHALRDAQGRTLILRGYNIKVNGLFDGRWGPNGVEFVPPLADADFTLMQKSGVNVLRLPINWSDIEPQKGLFSSSYLDAIAAFLDKVRPYGIYVFLDFHEDGWSKDLCEDGAPAWATVVTDWTEGGLSNDCHVSNAAISAHSSFFDHNTNDLQDAFAAMVQTVASRFVKDDLVLGYEIFNEPLSSDMSVDPFSVKIAQAIRQVDSRHLILWEPTGYRNFVNRATVSSTPFPVEGCVYAVHVYTYDPGVIPDSIRRARDEATAWGEPLFVTEHGGGSDPDGGYGYVDLTFDGFDQYGASSTEWIWNDGVVVHDLDGGPLGLLADGAIYEHQTRPRPIAIGGDLDTTTWDGTTLTVTFHDHPGVPATHDVFWNHGTPSVTCDGSKGVAAASGDPSRMVFSVSCGGDGSAAEHTLVFASSM
jgi:endoglycosylceramidase